MIRPYPPILPAALPTLLSLPLKASNSFSRLVVLLRVDPLAPDSTDSQSFVSSEMKPFEKGEQ